MLMEQVKRNYLWFKLEQLTVFIHLSWSLYKKEEIQITSQLFVPTFYYKNQVVFSFFLSFQVISQLISWTFPNSFHPSTKIQFSTIWRIQLKIASLHVTQLQFVASVDWQPLMFPGYVPKDYSKSIPLFSICGLLLPTCMSSLGS